MGRRRGGRPIHGWLVIDKPTGCTSAAVVGRVRRVTQAAKVGHGGTLDPLATGLLPLALGEATKTVAHAMDGEKSYEFTIAWGEDRDSLDAEGAVTATSDVRPDPAAIAGVLGRFIGAIDQQPPVYSALKVGGRRACDLARADAAPELAPRRVTIHALDLVDCPDPDHARFAVSCGKGTYVRALARDIAAAVGACGHVSALRRTRVGPFSLDQAISLEELDRLGHSAGVSNSLLPVATALDGIPALALTDLEAVRLRQGQAVQLDRTGDPALPADTLACATLDNVPVALVRIDGGRIRPVRVLNLTS